MKRREIEQVARDFGTAVRTAPENARLLELMKEVLG